MRHYLDMEAAIEGLAGEKSQFVENLRLQSRTLSAEVSALIGTGWNGAAADEFKNLFEKTDAALLKMATGIENWHDAIRSIAKPNGRDAIHDACDSLLRRFDGGGAGMLTGVLEFNDGIGDEIGRTLTYFCMNMDDVNNALGRLDRKAQGLSRSYNGLRMKEIASRVRSYTEEHVAFSSTYVSAAQRYGEFLNVAFQLLLEANSCINDSQSLYAKATKTHTPASDKTSPLHRAKSFTKFLMSLPEGDRAAIEELCYAAPEPYRTIFFAYIGKIIIRDSTDGVNGQSLSIPFNLGIFIDTRSQNTITINGVTYKEWYHTLFHEIGHSINYATCDLEVNKDLDDAIKIDVQDYLTAVANKGYASFPNEINDIINHIMKGSYLTGMASAKEVEIYNYIVSEMELEIGTRKDSLFDFALSGVSDVYGGATLNVIAGDWQHDRNYWGLPYQSIQREMFAENFGDGFLNYTEKRANQEKFLPTASAILNGDPNDSNDIGMIGQIGGQAQQKLGW
jgi:uncharacterized protein YukE